MSHIALVSQINLLKPRQFRKKFCLLKFQIIQLDFFFFSSNLFSFSEPPFFSLFLFSFLLPLPFFANFISLKMIFAKVAFFFECNRMSNQKVKKIKNNAIKIKRNNLVYSCTAWFAFSHISCICLVLDTVDTKIVKIYVKRGDKK